jgi:ferredoxin
MERGGGSGEERPRKKRMVIEATCCYCGTCANICPFNAIELWDDGEVWIDEELCAESLCRRWSCGLCAKVCPLGAIQIGGSHG